MGRRAVKAASWLQRSCAAFLLLRSVLLRTGADDSHIGLPYKKTKSILACSAQMAPGNAQNGVAPRVVMGTSSARPPAASDSQARRGTNTGDLRSTSWWRGFYVRGIINSFAGSKRKKNQRPSATRQMARETSEHGVGPSNEEGGEKREKLGRQWWGKMEGEKMKRGGETGGETMRGATEGNEMR